MKIESLEARCFLDAGDVDASFGTSGSIADPGGSTILLQLHDGRLVTVTGSIATDGVGSVTIRQFSRDGAARLTGNVTITPSVPYSSARIESLSAAVDSHDRIFVGVSGGIVCVLPNGNIDGTFGSNGAITAPMESVNVVFVQRDDKLVVGGHFEIPSGLEGVPQPREAPAIVRLTSKGKRDATFGPKGIRRTGPFENVNEDQRAHATIDFIAQDAQGRLVVKQASESSFDGTGGTSFDATETFKRINADGTTDNTLPFVDGVTSFSVNTFSPYTGNGGEGDGQSVNDVAMDRSDRMLVALDSALNDVGDAVELPSVVHRIKPDGTLDKSFARDGTAESFIEDNGQDFRVSRVTADAFGRVLILGFRAHDSAVSSDADLYLVRLRSDGAIDTTFGQDGHVQLGAEIEQNEAFVAQMRVAADTSILVRSVDDAGSFPVTRYWADDGPTVNMDVKNVRAASSRSQTIDLTINDDVGVLTSTFGRDLRITGPNGFVAYARFDHELSNTNGGRTYTVRYKLAAPGGAWDVTDSGEYVVELINRSITDVSANGAAGRILGNFFVNQHLTV